MKWPLFENKIKNDISGHRSEVDVEAIWSAIEPEVDAINQSKRKKRYGLFWLLLAGTLVTGSLAGYYFFIYKNNAEKRITANNLSTNGNNAANKKELIINIAENKNSTSNTEKETSTNLATPHAAISEKKNEQAKSAGKTSTEQNNFTLQNKTRSATASGDYFSPERKPQRESDFGKAPEDQQPPTQSITVSAEKTPASKNQSLPPASHLPALPLSFLQPSAGHRSATIPQASIILPETPVNTGVLPERRHPMEKKTVRFSAGVNAGISYAARRLTTVDSTGNTLIDLRENTEKPLETAHLGVQFQLRHTSGFDFQTGLQYTRITERFDYRRNITTIDSTDGVLYYAVNPNQDTIAVMGTVPHTTITGINKKYFNRYTLLDIPILAGYFTNHNNWNFGAQAGVFANISLQTKGRILQNEIQDQSIENVFKSSVGLSYYFGFSAEYKPGENIAVGLAPFIRYFPQNFATGNHPISQKYTLYGVHATVKYWF